MSGFTRFLGVFTVVVSSCLGVQAGPTAADKSKPAEYRLTVELKDGSRLVGKSGDEHLQFRSDSLGEMKLSLEKVRFIESTAKADHAKLVTASGDSLAVQFAMKDLRMETLFGEVKLPVALIKNLRVSVIGKGRPMDGLVGLWSGDGNTADSVSGNSGVNEDVSYTDGVVGQAFSFAPKAGFWGGHSCIAIADKPEYVLTQAFTIEGWVRPRGDGNVIFTRGGHRAGTVSYSLSMDRSHTLIFEIDSEHGENAKVRTEIPYGQWTHVAAQLDGDAGALRIYTNGVLAAEKKTELRPIGNMSPDLTPGVGIGNVNDGLNYFPFAGDIDEIALYNRVLSASEIHGIYAEHVADAGGRAELLPVRQDTRLGFPNRPVRNIRD